MTLPTGNSRNKESHCGRAFTLIELMLVMTMLVAVIAVTMPSLSNFFRGRSLDSEARRFLSLTRYGQERAVSEGLPMTLWIDTANGTYGLQEEPGYNENDPKAVSFGLGKDLQIAVVNSARAQQTGRAHPDRPQPQPPVRQVWISQERGYRQDNCAHRGDGIKT